MTESLIPSSITGKGSRFPPGGSVLDHAFGQSDPYTLGVEEEFMLLDGETFDLVQHIDTVLAAVAGHELEPRINSELMQSVLEVATPVCHTPAEVQRQLLRIRGYVGDVAREQGLRVGSAGTHPFSLFERQRITAKDRYRALVDQMQYIARRELIFGMHVHVAVDDAEKAIRVVNGLITHLPELVALSASSPFWRGEPTGLHSSRHMVFAAFPRSGPPPRFRDYADYAQVVNQLEKTGCIQDYTHIWWDIRLHPRLGTIEIRICDAVTRLDDVVAITAYCQALVKHYAEQVDRGEEIPSYHRILTTENKWLAARYGLTAPVMDLHTGRRNRVPVATLLRRTLKVVAPHARELGSEEELATVEEILRRGNGADRQLHVFNSNRDIVEVTREIAEATEVVTEPEPAAT
jgi:carboxylate-amine ligase